MKKKKSKKSLLLIFYFQDLGISSFWIFNSGLSLQDLQNLRNKTEVFGLNKQYLKRIYLHLQKNVDAF